MVYDASSDNLTKVAFIWVCDRDGQPAVGEKIEWSITGCGSIPNVTDSFDLGPATVSITNGFLTNTNGSFLDDAPHSAGVSYTKLPGAAEMALWDDKWPGEPCHHAVAAVLLDWDEICDIGSLTIRLDEGTQIGINKRTAKIMFGTPEGLGVLLGDANNNGEVDMGDVIVVKRIILGLAPSTPNADANQSGDVDMGDTIVIKRSILGLFGGI
jgi:hypothetical protein